MKTCPGKMCPKPSKQSPTSQSSCRSSAIKIWPSEIARTNRSYYGQVSLRGIYTITSPGEDMVYVPVGLGGRDGLPADDGHGGDGLGGGGPGGG